jgi:Zn-dependent peptidase ImmA (M78 family)
VKVEWLAKETISRLAAELLLGYGERTGQVLAPPIPVEDIIERHLELDLHYVDFYQRHGLENVFGALYVKERTIAISEALTADTTEGRLIFTCAHEVGHWCLVPAPPVRRGRRQEFRRGRCGPVQDGQGGQAAGGEWQADYFAGCLLMPEEMVRGAWNRAFAIERDIMHVCNVRKSFRSFTGPGLRAFDPCIENWHVIADTVRSAGNFSNVSKQSMIIRLQELGLVRNLTDKAMDWSGLRTAEPAPRP